MADKGSIKEIQTGPATGAGGDAPAIQASPYWTVAPSQAIQDTIQPPQLASVPMDRRPSSARSRTLSPGPAGRASRHTSPSEDGSSTVPQCQSSSEPTRNHSIDWRRRQPSPGRSAPPLRPSPSILRHQQSLQQDVQRRMPGYPSTQSHTSSTPIYTNPLPPLPQITQNSLQDGALYHKSVQSWPGFSPGFPPGSIHNLHDGGAQTNPEQPQTQATQSQFRGQNYQQPVQSPRNLNPESGYNPYAFSVALATQDNLPESQAYQPPAQSLTNFAPASTSDSFDGGAQNRPTSPRVPRAIETPFKAGLAFNPDNRPFSESLRLFEGRWSPDEQNTPEEQATPDEESTPEEEGAPYELDTPDEQDTPNPVPGDQAVAPQTLSPLAQPQFPPTEQSLSTTTASFHAPIVKNHSPLSFEDPQQVHHVPPPEHYTPPTHQPPMASASNGYVTAHSDDMDNLLQAQLREDYEEEEEHDTEQPSKKRRLH